MGVMPASLFSYAFQPTRLHFAAMNVATTILRSFYRAPGQFVLPETISGLAPATFHGEIADLRRHGYEIESHPHLGYRLAASPDRLTAEDIQARLNTRIIGSEILVFEETSSTNDIITRIAPGKMSEGLVVFAESQTKGRGRHGRVWISPRGKGLWFSILLRPRWPASAMSRLTVAASVAVARALHLCCGVDAQIKWPNDVTITGKKVAGILTELSGNVAVLGIGIDVNCRADEVPAIATSLLAATGEPHDRSELATRVLTEFEALYRQAEDDFESVSKEWAGLCATLGRQIVVTMGKRRIEGCALALDGDGALLLRKDAGQIERLVGGDLTIERA
jgi:BirA family transcriptional regulator, biotin operon repressor / biotin---[acetyl-CoA-carboxylase] ligase